MTNDIDMAIKLIEVGDISIDGSKDAMDACNVLSLLSELRDYRKNDRRPEFKPGSLVYIAELRDSEEDEEASIGGYILLMRNADYALLSPAVNDDDNAYRLCNLYSENSDIEHNLGLLPLSNCVMVPIDALFSSVNEAMAELESAR